MSEQDQAQNKVAMVIIAHPDDAEFGCAGTVAMWVKDGWNVHYVICTDASGGGSDAATNVDLAARQITIDTRKAEQHTAGEILGLKDIVFLDYPDGLLMPTLELRRDLVRLLRHYRPTRVICQSPDRSWTPTLSIGRYHPDHLAAGQAALAAIYPMSQNPWDFPELMDEGLLPHRVREIYIMGAPVYNYAVDITEVFELKMRALRAHESQVMDHIEQLEKRIRDGNAASGGKYEMTYAEEFHRTEN
jgi:LmbE family N-acetylglucosaminyl deacetylase